MFVERSNVLTTENSIGAMRVHHVRDALLRPRPSPLLSFLAPSVSSTWVSSPPRQPLRNIRLLASKTPPLNASTATAAEEDEPTQQPRPQFAPRAPPRKNAVRELMADLKSSNRSKPRPKPTTTDVPIYSNPRPNGSLPGHSSADIVRKANFENRSSRGYLDREQGKIENSFFPTSEFLGSRTSRDLFGSLKRTIPKIPLPPPPIRLDAFIGRSEVVDPEKGVDLGRAWKKLDLKLTYNNVRGDATSQRFHERPGLKRKRLKSSRWRKRFKQGFQAVVRKVQDMTKRGW